MSVDLSDLIENLKREVNPPGSDIYAPNATDDNYLGFLQDGFWEAYLDGLLGGYSEDGSGIVTPVVPSAPDMGRDFQQIVIMYAGVKIVRTALLNVNSKFAAAAGPVSIDIETSAQVLQALLADLKDRRVRLLRRLMDAGFLPWFSYIDMVEARGESIGYGFTEWLG